VEAFFIVLGCYCCLTMLQDKGEVTALLDRWNDGDHEALAELMPLIVEDLRLIARKHLSHELPGHTLQPTALVNEVYLRLKGRRQVSWQNKAQFFAFVAGMMRHVLVDHARSRKTSKRGSGAVRISLDESIRVPLKEQDPDILALDDALKSLAEVDPRQSRIVEMRYFTGLSIEEVAEVEQISPTTVKREWRTAKLWLYRELSRK
jgi:RNA polymerase sigma factor (TIGR02999 family)